MSIVPTPAASIPDLLVLTKAERKLSLYSDLETQIGTYDVTLRVTLDDYTKTKDITFKIQVSPCIVVSITPSSEVANKEYLIG